MQDDLKTSPVQIVVNLWVIEDQRDLFIEYETQAMKIMSKYGGRLVSAIVIKDTPAGNPPSEVHQLEFPDMYAFENYRNDEELKKLSVMRTKCINATEIYIGQLNQKLFTD